MTSVKTIFKSTGKTGHPGTLYYRIIHNRHVRHIHTGVHLLEHEWDPVTCTVARDINLSRDRSLATIQQSLNAGLSLILNIIKELEMENRAFDIREITDRYRMNRECDGFITFCRHEITKCRQTGQASSAEHFSSALNSFIRFHGYVELPFDMINSTVFSGYEKYLKDTGLCLNTISFYMRKLRVLYHRAVDSGLTSDNRPFKHVYTGIAKTVKRAISLDAMRALKALPLVNRPADAFARDIFLFSFYTCGMAPVDIAYMKKRALQDGILSYRRRKTAQIIRVRWTAEMESIVSRHGDTSSCYLLPLIRMSGKDERRQYLSATHLINRHLKKIGREIGLSQPLTLYVARHTWASIAINNNVPIHIISQGMGHDSERTTRIYISTLDTTALDKANENIIGLISSCSD